MHWCDQLLENVDGAQTVNDSKTPSGRAHVGALRGVLIHDAVFRVLREKGVPVRYLFGVDDYDPLDELPKGQEEAFQPYLGAPLCNVPAPPGSEAPDMAEHFIREFFDVFDELGVKTERYRMRDVYRSGRFNQAIDAILAKAGAVRQVYRDVSNSMRPDDWHPFQVICEQCGRIGTTVVTAFDGEQVEYRCEPNLVSWAVGCGSRGKVSPFDGNGKLPWKLEWCAKWHSFPVTIEGAGQDHSTKGGSRDVSAACLRVIFGDRPPLNIPYGFFLVEGAKMSSSKGLGATAREMADFLPPETLRYLMIRTPPKRPVNFSPSEKYVVKLFNEFDRLHRRRRSGQELPAADRRVYDLSILDREPPGYLPDFQWIEALIQMPHLDPIEECTKRKGAALTGPEREWIDARIRAANYWLDHFAEEHERIRLQDRLPESVRTLSPVQHVFLRSLAVDLADVDWTEDAIQTRLFRTARLTPIAQPKAFAAIYRAFLDRDDGPKAGSLLSFLDREEVLDRCRGVAVDVEAYWADTAESPEAFEAWLTKERPKILSGVARAGYRSPIDNQPASASGLEFFLRGEEGRDHLRRIGFSGPCDANAWLKSLRERFELSIEGP